MALNFPDNPTLGETYTDNTSGFSYEWDGVVWRSYSVPSVSNIKLLDDISGLFNNVLLTFPLTVNGQAVLTATSKQLILSIGGVIQSPSIDFNVVGSNIVFTTAPTAGLSFFGTLLGGAQIEVEYSSTAGISSYAASAGISTVSQGLTGSPSINITNIVGVAATFTGNVSIAGTLTYEDVTSVDSVGLITARNGIRIGSVGTATTLGPDGSAVFSGIVTATSFFGNGSGLTGISSGRLLRAPQVLTSGTSYTTPAGCAAIYVECIGAGGAGGGATSSGGSGGENGGGGGGSGAYCAKYFAIIPSTTYNYQIGIGGTGVSAGSGNTGGNTTFTVGAVTLQSNGGGGGTGASASSTAGGNGGTASNGDINIFGNAGSPGFIGVRNGGNGGASFFGGSGIGVGYTAAPGGIGYHGSGGGGAASFLGGGNQVGGDGGNGLIRILEYI